MFVLLGQVLNARQKFGPMMWAPIANNLIAIVVLSLYLLVWGKPTDAEQVGPFSSTPGARARPRLHAGHRRAVPHPAALPAPGGLPLPPALRLPRHRAGPHRPARRVDRALRGGQPAGLPRRHPARLQRHGRRRRHRQHRLLEQLPHHDGAARHRDGLADDGDPAAALRLRLATGSWPTWAAPSAPRCAPRWWSCCPSRRWCRSWRRTSPGCCSTPVPAIPAPSRPPWRSSAPRWSSSPSTT